MATHLKDYKSVEGTWTACGRYFADNAPMPRGVTVSESDHPVSCQSCLGTERLKIMRAGRHKDAERAAANHPMMRDTFRRALG